MKKYYDLNDKLLRELCVIPAPSGLEDKRVEYITNILHSWGFKAETDDAKKEETIPKEGIKIFDKRKYGRAILIFIRKE